MNKNILLGLMLCMVFISFVSAQEQDLGIQKQGECINLIQSCADCTYNNISNVLYPNSSLALGQVTMNQSGVIFNYTFCSTSLLGEYLINGYGDLGGVKTVWAYTFDVTYNGNPEPEGNLKVIFFAFFLLILFGSLFSFLKMIGHWKDLNVDILDLATAIGLYLVIWTFYYLCLNYLGDKFITDILDILIYVGAITHVIIPITAFLASLLFNPFKTGGKFESG